MVARTPRIPASAHSFASMLAQPGSLAARWDRLITAIDDCHEAAEALERETCGGFYAASSALNDASLAAASLVCKAAPTTPTDVMILVKHAAGAAEFSADNHTDVACNRAATSALDALTGIGTFIEGHAACAA